MMYGPTEDHELAVRLDRTLDDAALPGRLLVARLWGSRSYNLHVRDSDWDFAGVFVTPPLSLLGLATPAGTVERKGGDACDYVFHELGKFCHLLLKGGHNTLETLFAERGVRVAAEPHLRHAWERLVAQRRRFCSASAVRQYLGFASGQLRRLRDGLPPRSSGGHAAQAAPNPKWLYHLLRLLLDAQRLALGREPSIWKEAGSPEHQRLHAVRRGEVTADEVRDDAERLIAAIDGLKPWPIPEAGDRAWLDGWLTELRLAELDATRANRTAVQDEARTHHGRGEKC